MKTLLFFVTNLCCLLVFSSAAHSDIYAEYQMTGVNNTPIVSKMYGKNGNVRTEVTMNMGGIPISTFTLMLTSKPNTSLVFNSLTKTYNETKISSTAVAKDVTLKILGDEKVGSYNCTHVKMSSGGKSWDVWYAKGLPAFNFPITGNSELSSQKVINELQSKGITGMLAKIVFLTPGAKTKGITMQLIKTETKALAASLFTIPAGYKKSSVVLDPEKMKTMTFEQKQELMMQMMREQGKH